MSKIALLVAALVATSAGAVAIPLAQQDSASTPAAAAVTTLGTDGDSYRILLQEFGSLNCLPDVPTCDCNLPSFTLCCCCCPNLISCGLFWGPCYCDTWQCHKSVQAICLVCTPQGGEETPAAPEVHPNHTT